MMKQIKNYNITNFKNRSRAMKKLTLISLIFILLVSCFVGNNNIDKVKKAHIPLYSAGTVGDMVNAAFDKVTWEEKVLNPDRTYTYLSFNEKKGQPEEVTKNGKTMVIMRGYIGTNVILMGFNADNFLYGDDGIWSEAEIVKLNGKNAFIGAGGIYQVIENAYKENTKVSMENLYVRYY